MKEIGQGQYGTPSPACRAVCRSGGVAQLVRALDCHSRGCGFEPRRSRSMQKTLVAGGSIEPHRAALILRPSSPIRSCSALVVKLVDTPS